MKLSTVKDIAEIFGIVSGVVVMTLGVMEYIRSNNQSRHAASLQYVLQLQSASIRNDYDQLDKIWNAYDLEELSQLGNRQEITKAITDKVLSGETGPEFLRSFDNMVSFIDAAGSCVQANVCDEGLLKRELESLSSKLTCLHGSLFKVVATQQQKAHFGEGVRFFAGSSACAL